MVPATVPAIRPTNRSSSSGSAPPSDPRNPGPEDLKTRRATPAFSLIDFLIDLLIDLAFIGLGVALYFQFKIQAIFPIALSPALTDLVGGREIVIYLICGVPLVIGMLSLSRTILRNYHRLRGH
jgi:hypothetical protein